MSDLSYTIGLDGGSFMAAASRAISVLGSMELAVQGIVRAAGLMTSAFAEAADLESITTAIGTITKSATVTSDVLTDLRQLAANSPLELKDLAPAARQLLAAGVGAREVSRQLRILGDVASSAGTDLGGIVTVFNQVQGKGKMLTEEFMQFAERGVAGLREEIAKVEGIRLDQVADAMSRGTVSAMDLQTVFQRMTSAGGIAFNAMSRQAETFYGRLSTLRDGWTSLQVAFAAPINEALKPIIDDMTRLTAMLTPAFQAVGSSVAEVVSSVHAFIAGIAEGHSATVALANAFGSLLAQVGEIARIPLDALMSGLPNLAQAFADVFVPATNYLLAKMEEAAHLLAAVLMRELGSVLQGSVLTRGLGQSMSQAGAQQRDAALGARMQAQGIVSVDLSAGLMRASTDLSAAAALMRDAFAQGINQVASSRFSTEAAQGAVQAPPARTDSNVIDRNAGATLEVLRSMLGELQRINTQ